MLKNYPLKIIWSSTLLKLKALDRYISFVLGCLEDTYRPCLRLSFVIK